MNEGLSLSHLIERLEKATGPDREMDAAIFCALNPGYVTHHAAPGYAIEDQHGIIENGNLARSPYISSSRRVAPQFTKSIDAAMTLVPQSDDPTWRWRVVEFQEWNKGNSYWFWRARISGWPNMRPVYECGEHPISPIALCIASLKARLHDRD